MSEPRFKVGDRVMLKMRSGRHPGVVVDVRTNRPDRPYLFEGQSHAGYVSGDRLERLSPTPNRCHSTCSDIAVRKESAISGAGAVTTSWWECERCGRRFVPEDIASARLERSYTAGMEAAARIVDGAIGVVRVQADRAYDDNRLSDQQRWETQAQEAPPNMTRPDSEGDDVSIPGAVVHEGPHGCPARTSRGGWCQLPVGHEGTHYVGGPGGHEEWVDTGGGDEG